MRFKTFKIGKPGEEPEEDAIEFSETTVTQIAEMGEQISSKTRDLEKTAAELGKLSSAVDGGNSTGDTPRPHGPLSELSLDANGDAAAFDEVTEAGDIQAAGTPDDIQLVELNTNAAPAEAATPEGQPDPGAKPAEDDDSDSFNNLFGSEEEEENPLANLIESLPDVTVQELLDDIREINEIIQEWRQG